MTNLRKKNLSPGWYPFSERDAQLAMQKFEKEYIKIQDSLSFDINKVNCIIVPHAGWEFSGFCSYCAFKKAQSIARQNNQKVEKIVLFGGHLGFSEKSIVLNYQKLETPFGFLDVDTDLINDFKGIFSSVDETDFFSDNTIEVNLPFIKYFFPDVKVIALYPPLQEAVSIAKFFSDRIDNGFVIASSDLTHYGPNYGFTPEGTGPRAYQWACKNDQIIIDAILNLDYDSIENIAGKHHNSCSPNAIIAALAFAKYKSSIKAYKVYKTSSYELFPSASFVGYLSAIA